MAAANNVQLNKKMLQMALFLQTTYSPMDANLVIKSHSNS
jgi:hypothetical protein